MMNSFQLPSAWCSASLFTRQFFYRGQNLGIGAAPAQVSRQIITRLLLSRMRMVRQQAFYSHDHTRRAIPALKSLVLEKCPLHRIELAVAPEPFDGYYFSVLAVWGKHETRAHWPAIDQDRARTANTHAAAFNGTFEQKIIAQTLQQRLIRPHGELLRDAVDRRLDGDRQVSSPSFLD